MGSSLGCDAAGDRLPATICALPWVNLSLDVDGSSRPCCKFAHLDADSPYQMANLRDEGLPGVWNSDAMQRLRRDFRSGVAPAECRTCWDEEAAGVASWRQTFLADRNLTVDIDFDDPMPGQPVALDLKLSNTCNLRCRICGPVASSSWLAEELAARGPDADPYLVENRAYFKAAKLVGGSSEPGALERWAPGIQHIEMTGGEPMLSLENRRLVALIVDEGRPEDVTLHVTTNATVIDDDLVARFPRFRHVEVVLSIDDIGERLTYQRAPADWDTVRETITRWAELPGVGGLGVNCSVSIFNVWDLAEVLDWFTEHHPGLEVHLNLVHNPPHLSVRALPAPVVPAVVARLRRYGDDLAKPVDLRLQMAELATFMEQGEGGASLWGDAVAEIRHRDQVRGESFAVVAPSFCAELDRLGVGLDATVDRGVSGAAGVLVRLRRRAAAGLRR